MILRCYVCNDFLAYTSIQPHIIACYAHSHNFGVQDASFNPKYSWAISYHANSFSNSVIVAKYRSACTNSYSITVPSAGTIYWDYFIGVLRFIEADIDEKRAF